VRHFAGSEADGHGAGVLNDVIVRHKMTSGVPNKARALASSSLGDMGKRVPSSKREVTYAAARSLMSAHFSKDMSCFLSK
jgi:hypothetical protein